VAGVHEVGTQRFLEPRAAAALDSSGLPGEQAPVRRLGSTLLFAIGMAASGCIDETLDADRSPPAAIGDLSADLPISTTLRLTLRMDD
jgi:hypothetical protein